MRRPWLILLGGIALALLAYGGSFLMSSAKSHRMTASAAPELSWLQTEFHLSDSEFERIEALHSSYQTGCAERCLRIDAKSAELQTLLSQTNTVTPEIERTLRESAQLRAECQAAMLQHFYQISQMMPPAQGKRYFDWVVGRTFGSEHAAMMSAADAAPHEHHHE